MTVPLLISMVLLTGCASARDAAEAEAAGESAHAEAQRQAELTDHGGIVVSGRDISGDAEDGGSPAEVVVYEDFQCPFCGELEQATGDYLEQRMLDGEITVEYRIVSFLDSASKNEYSSRAANAALCVFDDAGPGAFYDLHEKLYANQPAEGTSGPDNGKLAGYASDAGADVGDCIAKRTHDEQVTTATQDMSGEGVTATPTVLVDGKTITLDSETAVEDAVEKAVG